jgi:outer membrane cobalamin receptor
LELWFNNCTYDIPEWRIIIFNNRIIVLKTTLLYILLFLPVELWAQMSMDMDTVRIGEVVINATKSESSFSGMKRTLVDSSVLKEYSNNSISDLLTGHSLIFIKSYGSGGVASPSFRGTGANHTIIDWNGVNINNPMLGQSDLSIIPAGLIDNINVYYGGASMVLNNGGIGGAINLETGPEWEKQTGITLNAGMGSFGEFSGLMKVRTGNTHIQSVTKAYLMTAENNFRYLDNESSSTPAWKTRTNNQMNQQGFIQELYYRNTGNTASARIWYQSSYRHLPPTMISSDENERQSDESLRIMLSDNLSRGSSTYAFTGAWLAGRLNYSDRVSKIDSRSTSQTFVLKAERVSHLWNYTNLKISYNNELCYVNSTNYDRIESRNVGTLTASLDRECIDKFGFTVLMREILFKQKFLFPDFSTALQYRIFNNREYFLKASISRNSGIPTFNELFYPVSGNPDLKNEYAFTYELTYEMHQKISSNLNLKTDITFFQNLIKDMIQWSPVTSSFWKPENINRVNSKGLEATISIDYNINKFAASLYAGYTYTKAVSTISQSPDDNTSGKQLIYIPVHQANSILRISYGKFYSSFGTNLTGKRYITPDDLQSLPMYVTNNTVTGIRLPLHKDYIDLSFCVNNLFDVNYQSIAHYPLPGRSYFLKILFQFDK